GWDSLRELVGHEVRCLHASHETTQLRLVFGPQVSAFEQFHEPPGLLALQVVACLRTLVPLGIACGLVEHGLLDRVVLLLAPPGSRVLLGHETEVRLRDDGAPLACVGLALTRFDFTPTKIEAHAVHYNRPPSRRIVSYAVPPTKGAIRPSCRSKSAARDHAASYTLRRSVHS